MTTDQNFFPPQCGQKPSRIRSLKTGTESGFFMVVSYIKNQMKPGELNAAFCSDFSKPYCSANYSPCEGKQDFQTCTFVAVPECIRYAGFDLAWAVRQNFTSHTQPEIAARIQPESTTLFLNKSNYEQQHSLFEYTSGWLYSQQQNSGQVAGWPPPFF
jgi:hypothetical protein